MATSVGGFFASLKLQTDQASFDKAQKDLGSIEEKIKKTGLSFGTFVGDAIKGLTAIGAAAVGAAYAVSQIQGKASVSATGSGMKLDEFNKWSVGMSLIGQNADDLASHLAQVNDAMTELAGGGGEKWSALADKLAYFTDKNNAGIDINKFKKASQTERMNMIADRINGASGDKRTALINRSAEIFGDSFRNMMFTFDTPNSPYKNIYDLEKQSAKSSTPNDPNALANMLAFNRVTTDLGQTFKTVGDIAADHLRKPLEKFVLFIEAHQADISKFFDGLMKGIGDFFDAIGKTYSDLQKKEDWLQSSGILGTASEPGARLEILGGFGSAYDAYKSGFSWKDYTALQDAKTRFSSFSEKLPSATMIAMDNEFYAERDKRLGSGQNSLSTISQVESSVKQNVIHLYLNIDKSGNVTSKAFDGSLTQ